MSAEGVRSSSSEAFDQKLRSVGDAGKGVSCFGWEGGRDSFESPLGGCISRLTRFPKTDLDILVPPVLCV